MLETLDILIGFTVVMLVVSMAVTMLTQFFGTAMIDLRGRALRAGVAQLLALMDRGIKRGEALRIADHVLRNPLVGKGGILLRSKYGLASVIHREELTKLILDFASDGDATKAEPDDRREIQDRPALQNLLRKSLAANGIEDPTAVLEQVRTTVVELEKTNPELSHSARLNIALLNFAASPYLSKLNSWFDQSIDRVSELFTRRIRLVTALVGLGLAVFLQLDSIGLINRLSVDDALRDRLVSAAVTQQAAWKQRTEEGQAGLDRLSAPPAAAPGEAAGNAAEAAVPETNDTAAVPEANDTAAAETNDMAAAETGDATVNRTAGTDAGSRPAQAAGEEPLVAVRRTLEEVGVFSLPRNWGQWWQSWWDNAPEPGFRWPLLFGILLSAALLSLGAPFWYSVLANLLKMRSVIARKDEAQREERQTTQQPAGGGGGGGSSGLPPALAGGERGDLAATG